MISIRILLIAALTWSLNAHAGSEDWLEAITRGDDAAAADILEDYRHRLPKKWDTSFADLIDRTVHQLRTGFDCSEKKKITLYRRMQPGKTDVALPIGKNRIVFPARAFMTKDRKFKSTGLSIPLSKVDLDWMKRSHSHPRSGDTTYDNSYLISTTNGDGVPYKIVPNYTVVAAVMRVCPERVIPGRFGEAEILLPFFIHANEIVGVIEMTDYDKFKVLYRGLGMSEREVRETIIRLAEAKAEEKAKPRSCAAKVAQ